MNVGVELCRIIMDDTLYSDTIQSVSIDIIDENLVRINVRRYAQFGLGYANTHTHVIASDLSRVFREGI